MRILGIDTATWKASVALVENDEVIAEESVFERGNHVVSIVPLIDSVLGPRNLRPSDLDGVALSIGPGSFTGIRIGVGIGKGLAIASGVPLIPVSTLEALALSIATDHFGTIWSLLDARKGEWYAAAFSSSGKGIERLHDDAVGSTSDILEKFPTPQVVIGDAMENYSTLLVERFGKKCTVLPFPEFGPSAAAVARLGLRNLQGEGAVDR